MFSNLHTSLTHFSSCFIGEPGVFFAAFLGPIFAILLFNAAIFMKVIRVLVKHYQNKHCSRDQANRQTVVLFMTSIIVLMVFFGLIWVFGTLTVRQDSTVFLFPFAILNSLQGFFIFLFFCVFGKEGRELWLEVLCCGRRKIPGITVPTQSNTKRLKCTTPGKPLNTLQSSESKSSQGISNPMALQLKTMEENHINKSHLAKDAEKVPSFLHSFAKELEITGDEQHNNGSTRSTAKGADHKAKPLPVLVRRSSIPCHHVEIAEVYCGDSEDDMSKYTLKVRVTVKLLQT